MATYFSWSAPVSLTAYTTSGTGAGKGAAGLSGGRDLFPHGVPRKRAHSSSSVSSPKWWTMGASDSGVEVLSCKLLFPQPKDPEVLLFPQPPNSMPHLLDCFSSLASSTFVLLGLGNCLHISWQRIALLRFVSLCLPHEGLLLFGCLLNLSQDSCSLVQGYPRFPFPRANGLGQGPLALRRLTPALSFLPNRSSKNTCNR